jgi:hypothetical protein
MEKNAHANFGDFTIDPNTVEGFDVPGNGSFNFEITQVPVSEPTSLHLIVIGLAPTSWRLRRLFLNKRRTS